MNVLKLCVETVIALGGHSIDVDSVVMRSNCEVLAVGRIFHNLAPLSGV